MSAKITFNIPAQLRPEDIAVQLQDRRSLGETITIRQHLENIKYFTRSPELSFDKYLRDIGINLQKVTMRHFLDLEDYRDLKWLFPEMIISTVFLEIDRIFNYKNIVAFEIDTTSDTISIPYVYANKRKKTVDVDLHTPIGVKFDSDTVTFGVKKVDIGKYGRQINLPYEHYKDVPFPLLAVEFKTIGMGIAFDLRAMVVKVMVSGDGGRDQKGTVIDSSALSIGVESQTNGITYDDILNLSTRMWLKGAPATNMMACEKQYNKTKRLPEYSERKQGVPEITLKEEGEVTTPRNINLAPTGIPDKNLLLFCKELATGMFTLEGLQTEAVQIIDRQIHLATVWIRTGFANILRKARALINGNADFNDTFPEYLDLDIPQ